MKINEKVRCGLRTMIEIAINGNDKVIFQKDLSKKQQI